MKPKIIGIVGPTASGKSSLAVELARKFNGEVISADSRQVYKGLDIGTGKITPKEMRGIPHHLLDIASPRRQFTVAQYKKLGRKAIQKILNRDKLPIVCGGTGFYLDSLLHGIEFPEVPPNTELRKKLEKLSNQKLYDRLKKLDPHRAKNIDRMNPRRLIRAIEIATALGKVPVVNKQRPEYKILWIGIKPSDKELKTKIHARLLARMDDGMVAEARSLHRQGLSFKRMTELGLEYRYLALLLQNVIAKTEFIKLLENEIWKYSKRQMTWFKRYKDIHWFHSADGINKKVIEKTVKEFI